MKKKKHKIDEIINVIKKEGIEKLNFSLTRNLRMSFLTSTFTGASFSFQSGISSSKAVVWKTLPERIWPPISALF